MSDPRDDWEFAVAICTRDRHDQLAATLDALEAQDERGFRVLVVDQSRAPDPGLVVREADGRVVVIRNSGTGLSRARNVAARHVAAPWVAFVDDDCLVAPDWARRLRAALRRHPGAAFVSGHVDAPAGAHAAGLAVTSFAVDRETVRQGARVWPWDIGLGVCMVVRCDWIERLGGWDERLGAGVADFPAAEDVDFNLRLLQAGGQAVAVPEVRAIHDQWRTPDEIVAVYRGYGLGFAGFTAKLLRQGQVEAGLRMWGWALIDASRMAASGVRRRSRLRLRVGAGLGRGHVRGMVRGLRRSWDGPGPDPGAGADRAP